MSSNNHFIYLFLTNQVYKRDDNNDFLRELIAQDFQMMYNSM